MATLRESRKKPGDRAWQLKKVISPSEQFNMCFQCLAEEDSHQTNIVLCFIVCGLRNKIQPGVWTRALIRLMLNKFSLINKLRGWKHWDSCLKTRLWLLLPLPALLPPECRRQSQSWYLTSVCPVVQRPFPCLCCLCFINQAWKLQSMQTA